MNERQGKRFLMPAEFWNGPLIERWLEEKAAQGWLVESFRGYSSAKFRRSEPKSLRYRLQPVGPENWETRQEREEVYREMGWEIAGHFGDYRVYVCGDSSAPELFTDPESLGLAWAGQLKRLRRNFLIALVLAVVWLALQFRALWWPGEARRPLLLLTLSGMWIVWLLAL